MTAQERNDRVVAFFLILPSMIGFSLFFGFPAVRGMYLSFTEYDLFSEPTFEGLANYRLLFADEEFWNSLIVTIRYVLLNIPLQTILGLLIALAITQIYASSSVLRGIIILPWLLPNVVVGLLWLWLLDPSLGIINEWIRTLGFTRIPFLTSTRFALASIAGINIWRHVGYTALLFFAGLQTIPSSLYEAAEIDGASQWQRFWSITLPLIRPITTFVVITSVIGSFQLFDTVAVTTGGGPNRATEVLIMYVYKHAFRRFNMGFGSAASMILFLILLVFTVTYMKRTRAGESDLGS
jgi:multiple sugar transport system permease protein